VRGALQEPVEQEPTTHRTIGFTPTMLITSEPQCGEYWTWAFPEADAHGRAACMYVGLRVAMRVDDPEPGR